MFTVEKKMLGADPLLEGLLLPNNIEEIYTEIIQRREEIYPNCFGVADDSDYDYITTDWYTYHDYVCVEKFPKLKFIFPYIAQSLELMGDSYKEYFFKSWINIWPQGQSIGLHTHYGIWHGYFVIKDTETTTYYWPKGSIEPVSFKNCDGHYMFMSAKIPHMAQSNPSTQLRVSMGFNISDWNEVLREEENNAHGRGPKIRNVIVPLKEYL